GFGRREPKVTVRPKESASAAVRFAPRAWGSAIDEPAPGLIRRRWIPGRLLGGGGVMETTEILQALFRWIHVVAGIMWIGLLYYFNFVNGPFEGTLDGAAKKTVIPQLRPRALYWFRWGAAWTWIMGVLLVLLVYYHGQIMFAPGTPWTAGALLMVAITFLAFLVYDPIARSVKDNKQMAGVGFVLLAIVILGYVYIGNFLYRAYTIHTGALLGTLMAANVWMRLWPAPTT